ncbi:MAG: protein-L-isoaspartate O-methyltransferase family protein [Gemmataceae bacterium]
MLGERTGGNHPTGERDRIEYPNIVPQSITPPQTIMYVSEADLANQQMVDRLIALGALWSKPLIGAFRATPRHRFLERVFQYYRKSERWKEIPTTDLGAVELRLVYSDRALITRLSPPRWNVPPQPISSSSQPSLMAQMLEDLHLRPGLRVLEVGAGTGYNAALLAHVVGAGRVISIDVDRAVLAEAWDHLQAFPERHVELRHADGRQGWPAGAPFERIMVTAATTDLEPAWLAQLAADGVLLAPLALAPGLAFIVRGTVREGVFQGRLTRAAYFMALRAEGETGVVPAPAQPPEEARKVLPAPWAGWFDHKRGWGGWLRFCQALVFYAFLRGLNVHYQAEENGTPLFGVSSATDALCWLGAADWQVTGEDGRDLAWTLWRDFLAAGGPRPNEYLLQASPRQTPTPLHDGEAFSRQGTSCRQLWQIVEPRERGEMS